MALKFTEEDDMRKEGKFDLDTKKSKLTNDHSKSELPLVKSYPIKSEGYAITLPAMAKRLHGCVHCEWRGTLLCAFGFKGGKGTKLTKNVHRNGICEERINFLLDFSRSYKKKPSYSQWQRDWNIGMGQVKMLEDSKKLKEIEQKLDIYEEDEDIDQKELNKIKREKSKLREEWFSLWKELVRFEESQLSREQPRKIEVEDKRLNLRDMHRLMTGKAIDAEVVEDD